jgi:hypothetical protein
MSNNTINVTTLTLSYQLPTTFFSLFLFVTDGLNVRQDADVINGTIIATCNSLPLTISNGYFVATLCTTNLQLINTVDGAILYSLAKVSLPLVSIVKLNRFVFATVYF